MAKIIAAISARGLLIMRKGVVISLAIIMQRATLPHKTIKVSIYELQ